MGLIVIALTSLKQYYIHAIPTDLGLKEMGCHCFDTLFHVADRLFIPTMHSLCLNPLELIAFDAEGNLIEYKYITSIR